MDRQTGIRLLTNVLAASSEGQRLWTFPGCRVIFYGPEAFSDTPAVLAGCPARTLAFPAFCSPLRLRRLSSVTRHLESKFATTTVTGLGHRRCDKHRSPRGSEENASPCLQH